MKIDIIKAWKDEEYRSSLSNTQLETISNPVESLKLSDVQMENISGGFGGVTAGESPGPREPRTAASHSDCCVVF